MDYGGRRQENARGPPAIFFCPLRCCPDAYVKNQKYTKKRFRT